MNSATMAGQGETPERSGGIGREVLYRSLFEHALMEVHIWRVVRDDHTRPLEVEFRLPRLLHTLVEDGVTAALDEEPAPRQFGDEDVVPTVHLGGGEEVRTPTRVARLNGPDCGPTPDGDGLP